MVSKNKKKKSYGNPARGFATVSRASKSHALEANVDDLAEGDDQPKNDRSNGTDLPVRTGDASRQAEAEKGLGEITPEEMEQRLEESELLRLVEENSEVVEKIVARHFSKLETERRVLRAQVDRFDTHSWLPDDLATSILELEKVTSSETANPNATRTMHNVSSDAASNDLLIKLWILRRLLPHLQFSEEQCWSVLKDLVESCRLNSLQLAPKDGVWGLEFCLDWFGRVSKGSYNTSPAAQNSGPKGAEPVFTTIQEISSPAISSSNGSRSPTSPTQPEEDSIPAPSSPNGLVSSSESDNDSYLDLEPSQMTDRFLYLQNQRYCLHDKIGEDQHQNYSGKGCKSGNSVTRKLAKIDSELTKLRNDILFDVDEAESQWRSREILIRRELSERKKLGLSPVDKAKSGSRDSSSDPKMLAAIERHIDDTEYDDLAGEFFSSLPDPVARENLGSKTSLKSEGPSSDPMKIKDFGSWSGTSPRRILEETCRARDSGVRVSYQVLSESAFSNRHAIHLEWSKSDNHGRSIEIPGVQSAFSDRLLSIRMEAISCVSKAQSEAYVSTLALFLSFSLSPKEERSRLRLPSVWKIFWDDLQNTGKEQEKAQNLATLQRLKALIKIRAVEGRTENIQKKNLERFADVRGTDISSQSGTFITSMNPSEIASSWNAKSSGSSYRAMLESRKKLPIWAFKEELLQSFQNNQAVIVCGETGCGKSTQVPAFILENELSHGRYCKVMCTEPRRISAISLAHRVNQELGERKADLGTLRSFVGYAIRLENRMNVQTRLVYATTGVVMRMLENEVGLADVTHLVLDEVHERSIESDFLLLMLKKVLPERPDLRIILMSATVDADRFSEFLDNAPILNVPGRTFPVKVQYLEDAIETVGFKNAKAQPDETLGDLMEEEDVSSETTSSKNTVLEGYSPGTREAVRNFNEYKVHYNLLVRLLEAVAMRPLYDAYSKAILVFLPGIAEIRRLNDMIAGTRVFATGWTVHLLHSSIATEDQERAFLVPPKGVRKLVLATNIAETGITIPDVTCVIDTGKHKEMRFDEKRQLSRLIESFISRANAKQRRGRAGRVQEGLCFHLFTKHRHDNIMPEEQTPEMLRLSLQDLVLRVKICKLGGVDEILSQALDPPSARNIRRAVDALIDVKALTPMEDLTVLGRQLAKLPLDVFLGKLIIFGSIFSCLEVTLSIAAIVSSKSPFSAPISTRAAADSARLAFKKGDSDLLTTYNAYRSWKRVCNANGISEQQFCQKNFLNPQTLVNIEELKGQLLSCLVDAKFVSLNDSEQSAIHRVRHHPKQRTFIQIPARYDVNCGNELIVNSIIAWSFYPKLLKRDGKGWRNVASNQFISLHPTSVNKRPEQHAPRWLSFYHIMQSSNKAYNAHETSATEDFPVALLCGDADFRLYSGVIVIDGSRIRFSVDNWKQLLAFKALRFQLQQILQNSFRYPGRPLSEQQQCWIEIWQRIFSREEKEINVQ